MIIDPYWAMIVANDNVIQAKKKLKQIRLLEEERLMEEALEEAKKYFIPNQMNEWQKI